jgi:hypothetical protein
MKHTELEDGDQLVTRTELREVVLAIHEDMLEIRKQILDLKTEVRVLRNSMYLQIIVPALTLIVSLVIHYIFK